MAQKPKPNATTTEPGRDHTWIKRLTPIVGVAFIMITLGFFEDSARELLRYERQPILSGEVWRLITGHLVHLSWQHLWLNMLGWVLIAWLFGPDYGAGEWSWIIATALFFLSFGFLVLDTELQWYVGLSGLLHTGIVAGLLAWARAGDRLAAVALGVVVVKLAWEQWAGPVPFTQEAAGGPVVVNAHLYGALGGGLAAIVLLKTRKRV